MTNIISGPFNIKGRGYHTRGMVEIAPGQWSIPMFRNRDGAMLGQYEVKANNRFRAFEIARKECWEDFSAS